MDEAYYLSIFKKAASQLDKKELSKKQMHVATGLVLESVFLKLYKLNWANQSPDPLTAPSRIFFSVWINYKGISENKVFYNIHALKLRQLNGYAITSRQFATDFRNVFGKYEKHWPNVRTDFGPLTLMEGWVKLDAATTHDEIVQLAKSFLKIDHLIDELLEKNKKKALFT